MTTADRSATLRARGRDAVRGRRPGPATSRSSTTAGRSASARPTETAAGGARRLHRDGRRLDRVRSARRSTATGPRRGGPARRVPAGPSPSRPRPRGRGAGVIDDAVRRCIELSATKYCPVNAMLSAGATGSTIAIGSIATGPEPFDEGRGDGDRPVRDRRPSMTRSAARRGSVTVAPGSRQGCMTMRSSCIVMRPWRRSTPTTDRDGHGERPRAPGSARRGGAGRTPAGTRRADPRRRRRRDRLRRARSWSACSRAIRTSTIVGLVGRGREHEPVGKIHPHLAATGPRRGRRPADADAVFLALPHGAAAALVPDLVAEGPRSSTSGPTSGCATRPTTRAGTASTTRGRTSWRPRSTACPSCTAPSFGRSATPVRIVGAPGCYPDGDAPRARAARPGGPDRRPRRGREERRLRRRPRAEARPTFSEVNESVKAYGIGGHRHVAEMQQELGAIGGAAGRPAGANPGAPRSTSCRTSSR